ncbi:hypothetical protein B0H16DRAFT_1746366 [Mycena metata]|uniref:CxC2-like cysteine cluster KDZ transposase-associated domain-containing protein n=1 Tax=Mycena metata TaxID=1033252 RepID=A0AAD7MAM7_9AGAR|nr:hypothetical protein B0H16DRAFT_1746366 [Mycena metata]
MPNPATPDSDMPGTEDSSDNSESEDEDQPSFTLSQIDPAGDGVDQCDLCETTLGADAEPGTRAFRCFECEVGVQCEDCWTQVHFTAVGHRLQEWSAIMRDWGGILTTADVMKSISRRCGKCEAELAAPSFVLPLGTVLCRDHETGAQLLCERCCRTEHRLHPLHRIRVWATEDKKQSWHDSTLAEQGLYYDLGHQGRPCMDPDEPTPLLVVSATGSTAFASGVMDSDELFTFRSSRLIDTSFRIDGEQRSQATHTGDRRIGISDDGERRSETLRNITYKKRRLRLRPNKLNEPLAEWIPVLEDDPEQIDEALQHRLNSISGSDNSGKRKFYASSDNPMREFREVQGDMLAEMLRLCGLADSVVEPKCAICKADLDEAATAPEPTMPDEASAHEHDGATEPAPSTQHAAPEDRRIFRCQDCGEFVQCKNCCLVRHAITPLHFLKVWEDGHWTDSSLKELGLVYQLGHQGGPCETPNGVVRSMVVIDTTGIHQIRYRRCGCERRDHMNPRQECMHNGWFPATATDPDTCATMRVLEAFRLLTVIGNINAHDFIMALERTTSALGSTGMVKVPDRYKDDARALEATAQGETMTNCWTCPHPERNLVPGWREVEAKYRYLYRTILALDANFKLKNRIRVNERDDPPLGPSWGAWVDPTVYKEHLKKYVTENDVSTCIAFAALTQKDTKNTSGCRVSGVGGCVCARHECVRPNGLGDLQKGERYANMDFIAISSVAGFDGLELTFSYDIACQWAKNLYECVCKLPSHLQLDFEAILFQTGLPVWHASSQEAQCTNLNSLSFLPGVGKTDGEGIERLWAKLNAFAYHTKNMGLGHRADTIDDKINYHNWMKNLGQAYILRRKLIVAITERAKQVAAWKEVNKSVPAEVRTAWQERVDAFLADRSLPNPYLVNTKDGPSEAESRTALKADEEAAAQAGNAPLHRTSATAFLTAGLQLEDTQRRIKAKISGMTLVTADRKSKLQESRLVFLAKLRPFCALHEIYTPAAVRAVERVERLRNPDMPPVKAENLHLFLPSDLTADERASCREGLAKMEAKLRKAQCTDALAQLRARLHAKRHVLYWKQGGNAGGQHGATRANSLVGQITDRINATAVKYNQARLALLRIKGPNYAPYLCYGIWPLKDSDLTLDADVVDDESSARKKMSLIAAGKGGRTPRHISGTSRTVLSWIWASRGALDPDKNDLHDSLRVEWAWAKAQKT